ncbi:MULTISPECIES: DUF2628 domain-containing protein [Providencia]|uniref:DUF2628 domain-containing protein n=1 Tax=Providencia TaxID=586 RepID=UPI00197CFB1E|nr:MULTISPECIES: DUF2628 domain-containing protein [Providencia]MBN4864609.1 DUF2628 domain-containing protein [Providencia stuartii]MBN4873944.1 DUF2628 domain-containing protein [Providencia stuartii]MBN4878635.1 DUF2628 domain-containing protein [Providencia stuartii]MBN4883132.1 DUF2628 domain-containing protein [Providencia stuartii]HEM8292178.1 DUF2628 domain-containing protein [Providencia stuartii]
MEQKQYSEKWQKRFNFFDTHGAPDTPEFKAALKAESFGGRLLISMNFFAFFFGIIYFLILGLWKKGLVLLGISIGLGLVLNVIDFMIGGTIPNGAYTGLSVGISALWAMIANYAYYIKETKGLDGWNPFEGIRMV